MKRVLWGCLEVAACVLIFSGVAHAACATNDIVVKPPSLDNLAGVEVLGEQKLGVRKRASGKLGEASAHEAVMAGPVESALPGFCDETGGGGGTIWYSNPREMNYLTNKLERVVVVGTRATSPASLCVSGLCWTEDSLWDAKLRMQNTGFWRNFFSPPPIPAPACSPLVPAFARATTSHDDVQERQLAAGQTMEMTQGFNKISSNGKTFIVYYSDGGSELWQYATADPAHPKNKGDLKLGDGVSKCS